MIASVKALIASVYDSKTANTVENNIIKLVVKYHFLVSAGAVEEDAWLAMDGGLREAFKWCVHMVSGNFHARILMQNRRLQTPLPYRKLPSYHFIFHFSDIFNDGFNL